MPLFLYDSTPILAALVASRTVSACAILHPSIIPAYARRCRCGRRTTPQLAILLFYHPSQLVYRLSQPQVLPVPFEPLALALHDFLLVEPQSLSTGGEDIVGE